MEIVSIFLLFVFSLPFLIGLLSLVAAWTINAERYEGYPWDRWGLDDLIKDSDKSNQGNGK